VQRGPRDGYFDYANFFHINFGVHVRTPKYQQWAALLCGAAKVLTPPVLLVQQVTAMMKQWSPTNNTTEGQEPAMGFKANPKFKGRLPRGDSNDSSL